MRLLFSDVRVSLDAPDAALSQALVRQFGPEAREARSLRLVRRSLDARKKNDVHFRVSVTGEMPDGLAQRLLSKGDPHVSPCEPAAEAPLQTGTERAEGRVVVVGLGPAGLFAGHLLAQHGFCPLILERGRPIAERVGDVGRYWSQGVLDEESNVMFGEGGAGTFSDGKLTTRSKDPRVERVLALFTQCGAPEEILVDAKPHIGTDRLRTVIPYLRGEIERMGGEIRFSARLAGIETRDGALTAIRLASGERIPCAAVILAVGQGARDTLRMLFDGGVAMQAKPFAAGVRIEHPQAMVDAAQLGAFAGHPRLGAAEYRLTGKSGMRGVYTFCMCPGGQVVASASERDQIVVNGMSNAARDGENANSAVVVQVFPEDCGAHPLSGLEFAEALERAACRLGGGGGVAPAERAADFLAHGKPRPMGAVTPTYRPGVAVRSLWDCLPEFMAQGVADGIRAFGRQLRGFDSGDAVLTAVESRTSAPVRILRGEGLESVSVRNLYPVGEGAGYAGGIVSAAVDGLRAAEAVIGRFAPCPK